MFVGSFLPLCGVEVDRLSLAYRTFESDCSATRIIFAPSEISPKSAALIEQFVLKYLDPSAVRIVQGAVAETTALLKERWDHIFYTGNGHVGRIVSKAAAQHLTTVTLELGGKSPVIVDKSAKMESVISRVSFGKWLNAGQICIAPDYVLIHKDRQDEFVAGMKKLVDSSFGKDPKQSRDFGRIINSNHVNRIGSLLSKTSGEVVFGGMETVDADAHYFPPTIVKNAKLNEPLLREEIFGPVLPVVPVENMKEAVDIVNSICDRPLALYIFSEDKEATKYVLDRTLSGGVAINTSIEHTLNPHLPFGGVGSSGQGAYHGKAGFDEFTHKRSVFHQETTLMKTAGIPPAPYNDATYNFFLKATVTGFLTEDQKRSLKMVVGAGVAAVAGLVVRSRL